MTAETRTLLYRLKALRKEGLTVRAAADRIGITYGRAHGILYRHG